MSTHYSFLSEEGSLPVDATESAATEPQLESKIQPMDAQRQLAY